MSTNRTFHPQIIKNNFKSVSLAVFFCFIVFTQSFSEHRMSSSDAQGIIDRFNEVFDKEKGKYSTKSMVAFLASWSAKSIIGGEDKYREAHKYLKDSFVKSLDQSDESDDRYMNCRIKFNFDDIQKLIELSNFADPKFAQKIGKDINFAQLKNDHYPELIDGIGTWYNFNSTDATFYMLGDPSTREPGEGYNALRNNIANATKTFGVLLDHLFVSLKSYRDIGNNLYSQPENPTVSQQKPNIDGVLETLSDAEKCAQLAGILLMTQIYLIDNYHTLGDIVSEVGVTAGASIGGVALGLIAISMVLTGPAGPVIGAALGGGTLGLGVTSGYTAQRTKEARTKFFFMSLQIAINQLLVHTLNRSIILANDSFSAIRNAWIGVYNREKESLRSLYGQLKPWYANDLQENLKYYTRLKVETLNAADLDDEIHLLRRYNTEVENGYCTYQERDEKEDLERQKNQEEAIRLNELARKEQIADREMRLKNKAELAQKIALKKKLDQVEAILQQTQTKLDETTTAGVRAINRLQSRLNEEGARVAETERQQQRTNTALGQLARLFLGQQNRALNSPSTALPDDDLNELMNMISAPQLTAGNSGSSIEEVWQPTNSPTATRQESTGSAQTEVASDMPGNESGDWVFVNEPLNNANNASDNNKT